jgi:hypothetical protein
MRSTKSKQIIFKRHCQKGGSLPNFRESLSQFAEWTEHAAESTLDKGKDLAHNKMIDTALAVGGLALIALGGGKILGAAERLFPKAAELLGETEVVGQRMGVVEQYRQTESAAVEQVQPAFKFMNADGSVQHLSTKEVQEKFGACHTNKLVFDDQSPSIPAPVTSKESLGPMSESSRENWQRFFSDGLYSPAEKDWQQKQWLYGDQVRQGKTADLYVAKVNDVVGHGAFAGEDIEKGGLIGEYTGVVRARCENDRNNYYLFEYAKGGAAIDASETGNITRFINHSDKRENAVPLNLIVDDVEHVILIAAKDIGKGQQILFDYGQGYGLDRMQLNELGS